MIQLFKLALGYCLMAIGVVTTLIFSLPLFITALCIFCLVIAVCFIPLIIFMAGLHLSENL